MMKVVRRLIPLRIRRGIKTYRSNQRKKRLFGTLAPLVPSIEEMFEGPRSFEEFKSNGEEFLRIYREKCDLRPDERMLDVGCGIGRKTLPLTQYLNERAVYEGIDITKAGIHWCRERITARFPNFHFQQIDVYNKHYNPSGKCPPSKYRFPFPDGSFSFVMLGSVFTHMLPDDLENYLSEVGRVLIEGGRCLITYFLLNGESVRLIDAGNSTMEFKFVLGKYRTETLEKPELAIAFDEGWIKGLYRERGLTITHLDYGSWCGRKDYLSYQDLVLATKG